MIYCYYLVAFSFLFFFNYIRYVWNEVILSLFMLCMNILDNILLSQPPFPLLPLEDLIKAVHIFIGNFIQFDVEYKLTFSFIYVYQEGLSPEFHINNDIVIRNDNEFNHFITRRYQNTLSSLNTHWNCIDRIGYDPELDTWDHSISWNHWDPNRYNIHCLSVSLIKY